MHSILLGYLLMWKPLGYLIVFLGMFIEGDILLFTASFTTFQGYANFYLMLLATIAGVISGDLLWYWLGHRYKNPGWLAGHWVNRIAQPFDNQLKKRPFRTILVSKFAYGLHHAILFRAGALNFPLKHFLKIDLVSNIIWITTIGLLGYFSSASFSLVKHYLYYAEAAIFSGILFFFIFWHSISRIVRNFIFNNKQKKA